MKSPERGFIGLIGIALLLFILFISGCSSGSNLKGSRVRIVFRDTVPNEYILLAIRDSSLLIDAGSFDSLASPHVVPFSRIDRVYHENTGRALLAFLGGAAGYLFGGSLIDNAGGHFDVGPFIVVGMFAGWFLSSSESSYDPSYGPDLKVLNGFAKYSYDMEPMELRKIR